MLKVIVPCTRLALVAFLFAGFGLANSHGQSAGGPRSPINLRCRYLSEPLGVDTTQPRFSWILQHGQRGEMQSAYQVLVATKPDALGHDQGDQWDSGKVSSDDFTQVSYSGKALESGRNYYWKVRFWDKEGRASDYSQAAHFGMGLLRRDEWKGSWIGGGTSNGNEFRKEFKLDGKVADARVYIAALGYYELRVNGKKIGHNALDRDGRPTRRGRFTPPMTSPQRSWMVPMQLR